MKKQYRDAEFIHHEAISHDEIERLQMRMATIGAKLTELRRDYDGGQVLTWMLGKGVCIELRAWYPWCPPVLVIASNCFDLWSDAIYLIVFDGVFEELEGGDASWSTIA